MAASGGDVLEVKFSHPTIGQGSFFAVANQGNTFDPGGIRTADDAAMIDSSGEPVWQMNRVRGHFEILISNDMDVREDVQKVVQLASSGDQADWTVSLINGTVWSGKGKPVGDIAPDINASTLTLKVASGGFKKIL